MEENPMTEIAMEIISAAGDALMEAKNAMDCMVQGEFDEAQKLLASAEDFTAKAHNAQTEIIQKALAGEHTEYNLLFSHAQDTLMVTEGELRIYQVLLNMKKEEHKQ